MSHANHRPAGPSAVTSSARRRLLRGSFAAPSVLLLSSGSALAATSSLKCLAKQPNGIDPASSLGTYFSVAQYDLTLASGAVIKVVRASDITGVVGPPGTGFSASAYVSGKNWIGVTDGLNKVPKALTTPTVDVGAVRVALRFTNFGTDPAIDVRVTGLSNSATPTSGSGKLLSSSCWTSARPAP